MFSWSSTLSLTPTPTVQEAINQFLITKARAGKSERYLKELRVSLGKFGFGRMQTPLAAVNIRDIEDWLLKSNLAPRTQQGYSTDVVTLFNWAMKRGLVSHSPALAVERPVADDVPVEIHTPGQVSQVLEIARAYDLNFCRALAIHYFAGLRTSEAQRLAESEIKQDFIEVTALKSKTRRRRLVTIQPNLRAWLALGGNLPLKDVHTRMWRFTTKGFPKS